MKLEKLFDAGEELGKASRVLKRERGYARLGVDNKDRLEEAEEGFAVARAVLRTRSEQRRREDAERNARAEAFDRAAQPSTQTGVVRSAVLTVRRTLGFEPR